jgi:GTP cyclohydrolase I
MNLPHDFMMTDVQNLPDSRALSIDKVGIKAIRHPVKVQDSSGNLQHTVASVNMYVHLPAQLKGTHMSRFVEMFNLNESVFSIATFEAMLHDMLHRLDASSGHIEMTFPYFVKKAAPVTGIESLMDYEVSLLGHIEKTGHVQVELKVLVPVTSLCPCSKKIADYGAHNQRSQVTINAVVLSAIKIEDLIDLVESQASAQLYGLLKRPDEKYVTEHAYDNPKFVEDMVRDVAAQLNLDSRIGAFTVECENFESIHNHSAFAVIMCKQ